MTPDELAAILRELIVLLRAHQEALRQHEATMQRMATALEQAPRDPFLDP